MTRLSGRIGGATPFLMAGVLYLVLSVGLWWHVWSASPSSVMTCDCTDAGREVWYLAWTAFALTHGHQLLYSNWLFHPVGLNLLADTSVPAIGLALSPVTILAGPVAAVNVAATLIPALTALSMFWLLRRWVRWAPAAFVGGLAYGFSALVVVQLAFGWLNLACLALLPPVVACFDELYVRQRRRPAVVGAVLAVLVSVEFFISTEMVLILCVSALLGTLLVIVYAGFLGHGELRRRVSHGAVGIGVAVTVTAVLLAYPVWFFLAGPAHLSGMVWSTNVPGNLGTTLSNLWSHLGRWGPLGSQQLAAAAPVFGGYAGPALPSPSYLGPGLLAVVAVGSAVWRSDRRLWFFGTLGVVTTALSLRVTGHQWGPWSVVAHLPLFDNVVQSRFDAVVGLCAAIMVAVVVDRSRSAVRGRFRPPVHAPRERDGGRRHRAARWGLRALTVSVTASVTALVMVPVVAVLAPNLPLTVQAVTVPPWFQDAAKRLPADTVLLTYPFATADSQTAIPWQAIDEMSFRMAGGAGPAGTEARAGRDRAAFHVLSTASVPLGPAPAPTEANLTAVRRALGHWGVTMVVVPDDSGLARFQTGRGTSFGVALFTAVLGVAPRRQRGAWVWSDVAPPSPPAPLAVAVFDACVAGGSRAAVGRDPEARCVLRAASGPTLSDEVTR